MKNKLYHNKKRNTAFLYEALLREAVQATVAKDKEKYLTVVKVIKEFFSSKTPLGKELILYRDLYENKYEDTKQAARVIEEVKRVYGLGDQQKVYDEQTKAIKKINKEFGPSTFSNFVPNYKSLATISMIFNSKTPVSTRLVLEDKLVKSMLSSEGTDTLDHIDSLTYRIFVEKFNKQFGTSLLSEQKALLTRYIFSLDGDKEVELKHFLNEEVGRLKESLSEELEVNHLLLKDEKMKDKAEEVREYLSELSKRKAEEKDVLKLMKVQQLLNEMKEDDNQD